MADLDLGTIRGTVTLDEAPLKRGLSSAIDSIRRFGRDAGEGGTAAGTAIGDGISKGVDGRRSKFVAAGRAAGDAVGTGAAPASTQAGKKAADSFEKGFDVKGLGAKIAGGLAALGLGAAVVGLGKLGLETASQNEQATISFTTMLGSAQKADAFIVKMKDFAAKTPFEFAGLQKSASSLISIGIETDKIIPIMTTLGNVTSGMGTGEEGIKRAMVALQQMNAAGKIQAQDLNQLRDAGIPVYDLLAAAMKKPKTEIAEMASNGKLGKDALDAMMKALENGTGLERFSGLMDKQSLSLTGMISTFKDTLGQGLADAMDPVLPAIKNGLGGAADFLAKTAMPAVAGGIQTALDAGQGLYDLFVKGDFTGALGRAFNIQEDSPIVRVLFSIRDTALEAFNNVKGFGEWAGPTFAPVVQGAWDTLVGLVQWVLDNREWITPLVAGVVAFKLAWAGYVLVSQGVPAVIAAVKGAMLLLNATMAANPLGLVIALIAGLVAAFIVAYNTSDEFRAVVDAALKWVQDTAMAVGAWFAGPFVDFFKNAGAWIGDQFKGIGEWWDRTVQGLKDAGTSVGNFFTVDIPAFFGRAATAIGDAFAGVKDFLLAPIREAVAWINSTFIGGINGFLGVLQISWRIPEIPGFAAGGYTGNGPKHRVAGAVHAGEVVFSQEDVDAHGGVGAVEALRNARGYAGGGIVGNFSGYDPGALAAMQAWAAATGRTWTQTGAGGSRSYDQQLALYNAYLNGTGNLAANPANGGPHMVPAIAMDLSPRPGENAAAAALLSQFGLGLTVPGEPWHIQSLAGRGGGATGGGPVDFGIGALISGLLDQLPDIAPPWGDVAKMALGKVAGGLIEKVTGLIGAIFGGGGGATAVGASGVKGMAQSMAAAMGWGSGAQWAAIDWIISKESGWNPNAQNPTSTAYGLAQFLNSTWATVGASKTSDPGGQFSAFLQYVSQRYGTPVGAQGFWQNNGWYDDGGILHPGATMAMNGTNQDEYVLTERRLQSVARAGMSPEVADEVARRLHPDDIEALAASFARALDGARLEATGMASATADVIGTRIQLRSSQGVPGWL